MLRVLRLGKELTFLYYELLVLIVLAIMWNLAQLFCCAHCEIIGVVDGMACTGVPLSVSITSSLHQHRMFGRLVSHSGKCSLRVDSRGKE